MDVFAQQADVRGSSRRMVALFVLAVAAMIAVIDAAIWMALGNHGAHAGTGWRTDRLLVVSTLAMLLLIGGCMIYRIASLSSGGKAVAESLGGVAVLPSTQDPALRRLRNVIEEIALAAGTPVPDIYVMEREEGINAFAAGYSAADAAICVTRGCLTYLTREELQGVIAHEFSHVLNGDMRLNIRLIGVLYGIMALAVIGRQFIYVGDIRWFSRDDDDDNNGNRAGLIGLAMLAAGYIGYFFGRLIQAAVARRREALADVSAVQFTRQTAGIAGALKKIAAQGAGGRLQVGNRHEVAHMLFSDADAPSVFDALYATHPPLLKRIRRLDPTFREDDLEAIYGRMQQMEQEAAYERETGIASSRVPASPLRASTPAGELLGLAPAAVAATMSPFTALRGRASEPESALAMLLAFFPASQAGSARMIANALGDDVAASVRAIAVQARSLSPEQHWTLLSLAFPALRQLADERQRVLLDLLSALSRDPAAGLEAYGLARFARIQLAEAMQPRNAPAAGRGKLPEQMANIALVMAVVALQGASDVMDARRAWLLGMGEIFPHGTPAWPEPPLHRQLPLDRALAELDGLMPAAKELFLRGVKRTIDADGTNTDTELGWLRLLAASLHCALPTR